MVVSAVLLAGLLVVAASALELPPYIKPCSRKDPNLDECTLKNGIAAIPSIIKGDRKYKIPVVDPLKITEIRIEDANKGSSPAGLQIVFRDLNVHGLERVLLKKARFDLQRQHIGIELHIPDLSLLTRYEVDGKILVLPIKGKGDGDINMTDVDISYGLDYSLVSRPGGQEHMQAGSSSLQHSARLVQIHLDNLFNGDTTLGESTNRFLNENWEVLNAEIGPYIAQAIGEAIKQIVANCMDLVPYKDLFTE